jgi:hypothetical protein
MNVGLEYKQQAQRITKEKSKTPCLFTTLLLFSLFIFLFFFVKTVSFLPAFEPNSRKFLEFQRTIFEIQRTFFAIQETIHANQRAIFGKQKTTFAKNKTAYSQLYNYFINVRINMRNRRITNGKIIREAVNG